MNLVKKDIVKKIVTDVIISNDDSVKILEAFLHLIKSHAKLKPVKLSNFGTFFFKITPERIGRNPKTKENFKIESLKKLTFKPSFRSKKIIN